MSNVRSVGHIQSSKYANYICSLLKSYFDFKNPENVSFYIKITLLDESRVQSLFFSLRVHERIPNESTPDLYHKNTIQEQKFNKYTVEDRL